MVRRSLSEWPISQILKGKKDTITRRIEGVLQREQFIQGPQGGDKIGFQTSGISTSWELGRNVEFQPILFRPLEQQMHFNRNLVRHKHIEV